MWKHFQKHKVFSKNQKVIDSNLPNPHPIFNMLGKKFACQWDMQLLVPHYKSYPLSHTVKIIRLFLLMFVICVLYPAYSKNYWLPNKTKGLLS